MRKQAHDRRRRPIRPHVEHLETRLAPANVDVLSYHYDQFLTGANLQEEVLHPGPASDPTALNATNFGTLFSQPIDGQAYAQPLYKADLPLPDGSTHNVAFIATEHDSVYAFDADNGTPLWHNSYIDPAHGITTIPYQELSTPDIYPEIGITGTPVIDASTNTLYVVVKTKEIRTDGGVHYVQKLHALDLATGADKFGGPYQIGDTHVASAGATPVFANETTAIVVRGSGQESSGGANPLIPFSAEREGLRMSLVLDGDILFVAYASHADFTPYHGWVIGFDKTSLQPRKVLNISPNAGGVGIWESGGGISVDDQGYLYFAAGNGFNGPFSAYDPAHGNYSESVLKVDPTLDWTPDNPQMMTVADYFTPFDWQSLDSRDADLGSGGVLLLPDAVGSAAHPHLMIETGKSGQIYLIDRDNMGQFTPGGPDQVVQIVTAGQTGVWGNPSFFQINDTTGIIYYHGSGDVLKGYYVSNGHIDDTSSHILRSTFRSNFPGTQPSISADGTADPNNPVNGIVWEIQVDNAIGRIQGVGDNTTAGPATLRAFNPTDLTQLYYATNLTGQRDAVGGSVKFTVPVVTNGHVLIGTADHFTVLGLFPPAKTAPDAPTKLSARVQANSQGTQIVLNWTNPDPNPGADPTGIQIYRSTDGTNYSLLNTVRRDLTTFTDVGPFQVGQRYYYEVAAVNQQGSSDLSDPASVIVPLAPAVLAITGTGASSLNLSWTGVVSDYYVVERSTDGTNFSPLVTLPSFQTTYTDTGLTPGEYTYRIHAYGLSAESLSNVKGAWVGPVIDHGTPQNGGFAYSTDLTANGTAAITTDIAELTYATNQTSSLFSNTRIAVGAFTSSFQVRLHEGTQPNYADGFTFVIQTNSPTALGQGGAGIGYQGIGHSVAVKFSTFQHTGDPSSSAVGLVLNGANPAGGVSTVSTGVLLNSQDIKQIDLTYNGTTLTVRIEDLMTQRVFTTSFTVNIPQAIGSDTAYVGFTAATGSGGFWQIEDVLDWRFTSQALVPGAPTNLRVASFASSEIDLAWDGNSFNENGYQVERSTDAVHFTVIGTTTVPSFQDAGLGSGRYYYRVLALGDAGNSPYSAALTTSVPTPLLTQHQDIGTAGDPSIAGTATFSNGTYTLTGAGSDVWGTDDHFQYLYRPFTGDGQIIARVVTEGSVSGLDKAGVMFRESLASNARNAFMLEFPNPGRNFPTYQWRADTGGQTMDHETSVHGVPIWLRLVRSGNVFIGSWAPDVNGMPGTWTQLGAETVPMGGTVYVGLAVSAHTTNRAVTATFDHVQIIPAVLQASHLDVTASPSTIVAGSPVTITVRALDPYNNPVPGYRGTITFTTSDPQVAFLPPDYTFTAADNGVHTFVGFSLFTAGLQTVTATDTATPIITGSAGVNVVAGAAVAFQIVAPPSVASGTPFDITVLAVDAYGNVDTSYQGTVAFSTSDPDGRVMLPPNYTFTAADAGMATFPGGVTLITLGDQTITVTDIGTGITGSTTVTVTNTDSGLPAGRGVRPEGTASSEEVATERRAALWGGWRWSDLGWGEAVDALDLVFQEGGYRRTQRPAWDDATFDLMP